MAHKSLSIIIVILFLPFWIFSQINVQYNTIPSSFDVNTANPVYALDVNYDSIDLSKQAFHIFLPDTTGVYPLVVFIHGGGFIGGSRDEVLSNPNKKADIKYFLEQGMAYASFGYRLIKTNQADTVGVIKCLTDCKRALQFIRYHATSLYIVPEAIALTGSSAGAGTSLWLATRADMADANASDPVLNESTRVCAAAVSGCQATYDLYKWETVVYHNYDGQGTTFTADSMVDLLGFLRYSNFYGGIDSLYQILYDTALIHYRHDVDMLYHMSNDDPPLFINSTSTAIHPSDDLFHHPLHAKVINDVALLANMIEVKAYIPALGINTTQNESINEFIVRHLTNCAQTTATAPPLLSHQIAVYPNPASDELHIKADMMIYEVIITDILGKTKFLKTNNSVYASINMQNFPQGLYILKVKTAHRWTSFKIIKK